MKTSRVLLLVMLSFLIIVPISSAFVNASEPKTAAARQETVWAAGYRTKAPQLNPFSNDPAYGIAYMYEPLFGYNYEKSKLIPVIGKSYTWDTDGLGIVVELNTAAKWSDGSAITAADVVYSYECAEKCVQFKSDMELRLKEVVAVDADTVHFVLMNSTYKYTLQLDQMVTGQVPIVPKAVWTKIVAANADLDAFTNDWFDSTFDASWKVASGPYVPDTRSATADEEVYKKSTTWWGLGKIHTDILTTDTYPAAIGLRQYADNTATNTAFLSGEIDLHAGFFSKIQDEMAKDPYVNGWNGQSKPYYMNLGAVIEIGFNYDRAPLDQAWLHRAMSYVINYADVSATAGEGNWKQSKVGLIQDYAPAKADFSQKCEDTYGIKYDIAKGKALLAANAVEKADGWYTKVGNKKLGPYEILVPQGWSDVVMAAQMWAKAFTDELGIPCTAKEVDFGAAFQPNVGKGDFDMVMQCCGPHMVNNALEIFRGQTGPRQWNRNVSGWSSPEFYTQWVKYETTPAAQRPAIAEKLQMIYAAELPTIPTHVNIFFYIYRTDRWLGWLNQANFYQQPATAYTINWLACKQRLMLALHANPDWTDRKSVV